MNIETLRRARDVYRAGELETFHSPAWFSLQVDGWVCQACAAQPVRSLQLLALGGYGRGELYPFSDIDLLAILPDTDASCHGPGDFGGIDAEALAAALFLPLWDSGFDVGHGVRTLSETLALAQRDFKVLCSLLDARLLFGSACDFAGFEARVISDLVRPVRADLVRWLRSRHENRHRRFGETPHLLAPNIKEGRGGQRDLQTIRWLEALWRGNGENPPFLSPSESLALTSAAGLLSRVRVALHRVSRRKNETLHLELQPELAGLLGYGEGRQRVAVERFLTDLHQAMSEISLLCRLCLGKAEALVHGRNVVVGGDIGLDFSVLATDPANILELFRHSAEMGQPIGWHTRRIIQDRFPSLTADPFWPSVVVGRFSDILCGPLARHALEQMLEIGFLRLFIPEFADIENLVQFDAYHRLPAGPHLVETVRQLASYGPEHDFLGEELAVLRDEHSLRWAALLHDIAKGGDDHCVRGAETCRRILSRLGYGVDFVEECSFLVGHHLLLVHAATRRDLGEESVIHGLASVLGDVRRLRLLTLLTWADAMATGPKAWNPWIENLLRETYFKTRKVLEHGFLSDHGRVHRLSRLRDALRAARPEHLPSREFEGYLASMPPRYLMRTSPRRILEHVGLVRRFQAGSSIFQLSWEHKPGSGALRLTLIATDRPGLFARVCVALTRHHLSVLGAESCVWDDRAVVDVFWVTEPLDPLYVEQTLAAFEASLAVLLEDDAGLDRLSVPLTARQGKVFALDQELVRIHLDNNVSDFHTVLSIQAPDVPGLLATISLCLYRQGIDIVFAKIATQKDKAVDILHIREGGNKISADDGASLEQSLHLLIRGLYA